MQIQQRRRNPRRAGKKIWEKSLSNLVSLQAKLQGPQLAVIARSAANLQPRSSRMGSPNAYRYWYMRDGEQAELRPSILCSPTCSPIKGGSRTAIRRRFNAIDCLLRWFGTRRSVVQIHSPRPLFYNQRLTGSKEPKERLAQDQEINSSISLAPDHVKSRPRNALARDCFRSSTLKNLSILVQRGASGVFRSIDWSTVAARIQKDVKHSPLMNRFANPLVALRYLLDSATSNMRNPARRLARRADRGRKKLMRGRLSCSGAAVRTYICELTDIGPVKIHGEYLVASTGTRSEGHEEDLPPVG